MKKMIIIFLAMITTMNSFGMSKWWRGLIAADAIGALGGLAGGAAGAGVGAAVGSLTYWAANGIHISPPGDVPESKLNNFEKIGKQHNILVTKYLENNPKGSDKVDYIYEYVIKEMRNENNKIRILSLSEVKKIISTRQNYDLSSTEGIAYSLIKEGHLPRDKNFNMILINTISDLFEQKSIREFNSIVIKHEESILAYKGLTQSQKNSIMVWFTVFIHSYNLWGNAPGAFK